MKSITVHNIDTRTIEKIEAISKQSGKSLNKVIKELLNKSLGINESKKQMKENEFGEFFGSWTTEEYADFEKATSVFDQIDEED